MKRVQLREAQAPYNLDIDEEVLAHERIVLEQDGKPIAVIIPFAEYEELRAEHETPQQEDPPELNALAKERVAFLSMKEQLLETHRGQYVAFKDGELVDSDSDEGTLVRRLYDRFGAVPLYIKKVEEDERTYRIPGPRRS